MPDDTADEIQALMQKILGTKLWNEGIKASAIPVPPQYMVGEETVSKGRPANACASTTGTGNAAGADGQATTSRAEGVWGGKPWKTNIIDLEGDIMCSTCLPGGGCRRKKSVLTRLR